jgi:hypothetical protein
MTPHRSNKRGSLMIQRSFPVVGEIRRASGTDSPQTYQRILDMLNDLANAEPPKIDVLEAIRDGIVKPVDAYKTYRSKGLSAIATKATILPMRATMERWVETAKASKEWQRKRRTAIKAVVSHAKAARIGRSWRELPQPVMADLPGALRAYRAASEGKAEVAFNRARGAMQAFLRDVFGVRHWLYLDLQDVAVFEEAAPKPGRGIPPAAFKEKVGQLSERHRREAWELASTGMGWKEYAVDGFEVGEGFIAIHGKKRKHRERVVPLVFPIRGPETASERGERSLRRALRTVGLKPYDLRHTYQHWLEMAGIPLSRIDYYSGHKPQTMTGHYQRHDVMPYILDDAERMARYLELDEQVMRVVK